MKKHSWLAGIVALSLLGVACGDKATADKDAKSDSSAASSADKKADKKDDKGDKGDAKKDDTKKDDTKKDDAAIGGGSTSPGAGSTAGGLALKHLSDDCQVAFHLDVTQLLGNDSIKSQIVPALDDLLATTDPKDKDFLKVQALVKDVGFDYKKMQDISVCVTNVQDAEHSWGVVLGAALKPDTVAEALQKVDDKKKMTLEDVGGHKVLTQKEVTIGQAPDGSLVVAATKDMYSKLSSATGMTTAPLDGSKYLALAVRPQAVSLLTALIGAKAKGQKELEPLKNIKEITGSSDLASMKTEFVVDCNTPDDAKGIEALVTLGKGKLGELSADPKVAEAIKNITSKTDGSKLMVDIVTPKDQFDEQIKKLGEQIKQAKTKI